MNHIDAVDVVYNAAITDDWSHVQQLIATNQSLIVDAWSDVQALTQLGVVYWRDLQTLFTMVPQLCEWAVTARTWNDCTIVHVICGYHPGQPEVLKILLRAGADPLARDSDGYTALHYAAENDLPVMLQVLLAEAPHGAAVISHLGSSPLHLVVSPRAARILVEHSTPEMLVLENASGSTPLESVIGSDVWVDGWKEGQAQLQLETARVLLSRLPGDVGVRVFQHTARRCGSFRARRVEGQLFADMLKALADHVAAQDQRRAAQYAKAALRELHLSDVPPEWTRPLLAVMLLGDEPPSGTASWKHPCECCTVPAALREFQLCLKKSRTMPELPLPVLHRIFGMALKM